MMVIIIFNHDSERGEGRLQLLRLMGLGVLFSFLIDPGGTYKLLYFLFFAIFKMYRIKIFRAKTNCHIE